MKPIVEKILNSGIVDKGSVKLLETWGYLSEGASNLVNDEKLKNATEKELTSFAEELADEIEKEHHIRETHLDLERIRWPTTVNVFKGDLTAPKLELLASQVIATMDRMGRYYFRIDDVKKEWFVPGYCFERQVSGEGVSVEIRQETILESQQLFINDQPICWQVTTRRDA